jgi:hypothetical protein
VLPQGMDGVKLASATGAVESLQVPQPPTPQLVDQAGRRGGGGRFGAPCMELDDLLLSDEVGLALAGLASAAIQAGDHGPSDWLAQVHLPAEC